MIEVFIPTRLKIGDDKNLDINIITDNFLDLLKNKFININVTGFESKFFEGIKLDGESFNEDLIILCNGLYGEHYFADYDFFGFDFTCLGVKIIGENQINEKIELIISYIGFIINTLSSDELLTNSIKANISHKIKQTFFVLSGLIFLLYTLKEKTQSNIDKLNNYEGLKEYEGQSSLLLETVVTKKLELDASIGKVEGQIDLFIGAIKNLII